MATAWTLFISVVLLGAQRCFLREELLRLRVL